MNNYVPGFSNYLQRFAEGGQALPTEQPVVAQAAPAYPDMPADYAQRAAENARRAYDLAAQKSFGARGELSTGLDRIDTSSDFDYSPTAAQYLYDVGRYPTENTEYELSPMNLMKVDPQTGAPMPYTSGQLEQYAQQPLADQFYANFTYGGPGSEWDVGALQFAPNQNYRLIDRSTGDVVYSGTGYEAGKNISQMAKGLFDKSGQKADWLVQEAAPGSDQWTQRYEHKPDVDTLANIVGTALPLAVSFIPGFGQLGLAAKMAAAAGAGGLGAAIKGDDILKGALLSGATAGVVSGTGLDKAIGGALQKVGSAGANAVGQGAGQAAGDIVVTGLSKGAQAAGQSLAQSAFENATRGFMGQGTQQMPQQPTPSGGLPGGALPDEIVAIANRAGQSAAPFVSGALTTAAPALTQGPEPRRPDYGDKVEEPEQPYGDEIVVTGTGTGPGAVSGLGAAIANAATTADAAADAGKKSTLDKVTDYISLAGKLAPVLGGLFGGGSGQQPGARISGAMSGLHPSFGGALPSANIPGLGGLTVGGGPRTAADLGQQGLRSPQDYYRYGYGPEQSFFGYVPQGAPNTSKAYTGYAEGGFAVEGPGDGREDKIPAMLSDGEYVIDAETVALLGNGSNKAGADMLDQFRVKVRKHKGRELARGDFSKDAKRPEQYLAGGRA